MSSIFSKSGLLFDIELGERHKTAPEWIQYYSDKKTHLNEFLESNSPVMREYGIRKYQENKEHIDTITDEEYMQRFEEDRYKYGDKPVFMSKEEKFCILMGTLCVISWVIMVVSWLTS